MLFQNKKKRKLKSLNIGIKEYHAFTIFHLSLITLYKTLVNFGPLRPPWGSLGAPTPHFESLTYSPLRYLQNETNPRLLAQSV